MERSDPTEYYLQVVKEGDEPQWPRPEDEFVVGSQPLPGGFVQHWAYLKESGKEADELPHGEVIASENKAEKAAVLIDQYGLLEELELVLVKDGHAWGKEQTSPKNLEDGISAILDFAEDKFKMEVEHFMTTARVSPDIEKKLDSLEEDGGVSGKQGAFTKEEPVNNTTEVSGEQAPEVSEPEEDTKTERIETAVAEDEVEDNVEDNKEEREEEPDVIEEDVQPHERIRTVSSTPDNTFYRSGATGVGSLARQNSSSGSSKAWLIPVVLILVLFGGAIFFKDTIISSLKGGTPQPTPTPVTAVPTATPTPTPALDRSQYKVRVLNGTTKTGAAGTLATTLEGLGWEILSKGNAKDTATAQTTVRVKEGNEKVAETLIADLAPDLEASAGAALPAADKADVEVVIGKK